MKNFLIALTAVVALAACTKNACTKKEEAPATVEVNASDVPADAKVVEVPADEAATSEQK